MIARHLDTLVFVYQLADDAGEPSGDGIIRVTKARQGELCQVKSHFSGQRVRWMPPAGEGAPA
jgi:hypothetical protein